MAKVERRASGNGVKIRLNDDDAQMLLALLGRTRGAELGSLYNGLNYTYTGERKYVVNGPSIQIESAQ
jgi:hypothetical protein